ncbi:putative tubulin polyglutamylase TTLL9 [Strix uralensis]|uniref:putative tubulin polyglutamylase TTLL9 n=1 Tax=Strix uralensis TaxID=36305 RepID=UPI003DA74650
MCSKEGLTGKEKHVGGFDLIRIDGPSAKGRPGHSGRKRKGMCNSSVNVFSPGCYNDRKKLKQLFRNLPAQQQVRQQQFPLLSGHWWLSTRHWLLASEGCPAWKLQP